MPGAHRWKPRDYIGSQLEALAHFYACAASDEAYLDAAAFLEDRFLADTIHAYAQALRSYRQSGEAIEVLKLLEAFLAGGSPELPDNDKTRALLRDMAKFKPQPPLPVEQPHIINSAGINNCGGKCKINITVAEGLRAGNQAPTTPTTTRRFAPACAAEATAGPSSHQSACAIL